MTTIKRADFEELKTMNVDDLLSRLYLDGDVELCGGLDHIEQTKNQIKIYDRGCNGRDHSSIIRKIK